MSELTDQQITKIVRNYFIGLLDTDEHVRSQGGWGEAYMQELYKTLPVMKNELANCDHSRMVGVAQVELEELGIKCDEEDPRFKKMTRELLKAFIRCQEISVKREYGDYSDEPSILDACFKQPDQYFPTSMPLNPVNPQGRTVSDVIDLYVAEANATQAWKTRTETEIISTLQLLKQVIGDRPAGQITKADIAEFKQTIMRLPPNMNKMPEYQRKSIPEIIRYVENHQKRRLSPVTVKKYLMRVNALFSFAENNGYIETNPAKGVMINVRKAEKTVIAPFTDEDLFKLFNCEAVAEDRLRFSWQFWLIVMAPLTGCRLEEMCQLHLSDIRQEDGVWLLDINSNARDKTLKTESSPRLIPLHPFLIDELNLPGYVERLKKRGAKRLFPDLNLQSKGGYGRAVTRWFPKFRQNAGIAQYNEKGHKKVFHSFRHTFDTRLKHRYVETTMIDELMGHTVEKLSMGTYGEQYPIRQTLADGIMKLDFNLDAWGCLKKSKYIVR